MGKEFITDAMQSVANVYEMLWDGVQLTIKVLALVLIALLSPLWIIPFFVRRALLRKR